MNPKGIDEHTSRMYSMTNLNSHIVIKKTSNDAFVSNEEIKTKNPSETQDNNNIVKRFRQLQPPQKLESELDRVFKASFSKQYLKNNLY